MPEEEKTKAERKTIWISGKGFQVRDIVLNQVKHIVEAFDPMEGFLKSLFQWYYIGPGKDADIGEQWKKAWQGLLRCPDALVRLMSAVLYGPENRNIVRGLISPDGAEAKSDTPSDRDDDKPVGDGADKPAPSSDEVSPKLTRKEKDALEFSLFCEWIEVHATIDNVIEAFVAVMHNPSIRGVIAKIQGLDKKVTGTKSQVEGKSDAPSDGDDDKHKPVGGGADKPVPASPGASLKDDRPAPSSTGESVAGG